MTLARDTDFHVTPSANAARGAAAYDIIKPTWYRHDAFDDMTDERMRDARQCMIGIAQELGFVGYGSFNYGTESVASMANFPTKIRLIEDGVALIPAEFLGFDRIDRFNIPEHLAHEIEEELAPYYERDTELYYADVYFMALADAWTREIEERRALDNERIV